MNAIVVREFGGPEVLKLESIADPVAGPGQVVVNVRAVGVNPVDTYIRAGAHAIRPQLPYTPGSDAAGEILSVGGGVTGCAEGDRVYVAAPNAGTYGEQLVCSATQVHRLPDGATWGQGAALGVPYATAFRALFQRTHARPGETVLVHGATGGVGIATVELAHARGLRVIGTGSTDKGLTAVRDHGADVVVNHSLPDYTKSIMDATGGRGVDLIVEMLANVNLDRDLSLLAKHGRIVVVGNRGRIEINPREAMNRDATILGLMLFNASEVEFAEIHAGLVAGLANGTLNPIIGREMDLKDASKAHEAVLQPGALGKIVLMP
ncbi:MAG TPA: NADPH:quinone reductase [Vicinamibacterales bacterium]|jgi:NADPH2:quinone reductase